MMLVTTETISGKELETLGIVIGNTVQCKNFARDIGAGLKTFVGGEIKDYTKMLQEARQKATQRMIEDAKEKGADAIVNVRFSSSAILQGAAEIIACGTAVKFK